MTRMIPAALAAILVFSMLSAASHAALLDIPAADITFLGQDPAIVNPGDIVELTFSVKNKGIKSAAFEIVPNFPVIITNPADSMKSVNGLQSGQDFVVQFKIKIDDRASKNDNNITMKYVLDSTDLSRVYLQKDFEISIDNIRTDFDAAVQDVNRDSVSIGITNAGKNTASGVVVKAVNATGFEIVGANSNTIGSLESGEFTIVTFNINPAQEKNLNFDVSISYTDSIGERYSVAKAVSFNIPPATVLDTKTGPGIAFYLVLIIALAVVGWFALKALRKRGLIK
ncbi:MAG TPA: hypothetical protein VJH90_00790 [archaeon]|nr:hypothetical protein [archaeon]